MSLPCAGAFVHPCGRLTYSPVRSEVGPAAVGRQGRPLRS